MVNKATIARNLRELDSRYRKVSRNPRDPLYFSKLSLIELCGWIEMTMDDIVGDCVRKHLSTSDNLKDMKSVVDRNSGFSYDRHFREMLIRVVGLARVEELEKSLDPEKFERMRSSLNDLSKQRNSAAHTHLKNVTQSLFAPSVINMHFMQVYEGLKDIERCLRRLDT